MVAELAHDYSQIMYSHSTIVSIILKLIQSLTPTQIEKVQPQIDAIRDILGVISDNNNQFAKKLLQMIEQEAKELNRDE